MPTRASASARRPGAVKRFDVARRALECRTQGRVETVERLPENRPGHFEYRERRAIVLARQRQQRRVAVAPHARDDLAHGHPYALERGSRRRRRPPEQRVAVGFGERR